MRILVVDDCDLTRTLVDLALQWQTVPASSIKEGLRIARSLQPDVILLDVTFNNSRRTGIDALPDFLAAAPNSRIIIMTADYDSHDQLIAYERGASWFVEKGDPAKLREAVLDQN